MQGFYYISSKRGYLPSEKDKEQLKRYGFEPVEFSTLSGCFNKWSQRENKIHCIIFS